MKNPIDSTLFDSEEPDVAVVILNWNDYESTAGVLSSLQDQDYMNYSIIVVDNGSVDNSPTRLKNNYEDVILLRNNENLGFSRGINKGISYALDNEFDYVTILNNDAKVSDSFLSRCVKTMESAPDTAIVSGVKYDNGVIVSAGMEFSIMKVIASYIESVKYDTKPYEINYVSGAHMTISSDFLQEQGLFNEGYFFGMEDMDICHRARKNGWKIFIDPEIKIEHGGGVSTSPSPFYYYHQSRNRLRFGVENLPLRYLTAFLAFFITSRLFLSSKWILQKKFGLFHAVWLGIFDFLTGRPHKRFEDF